MARLRRSRNPIPRPSPTALPRRTPTFALAAPIPALLAGLFAALLAGALSGTTLPVVRSPSLADDRLTATRLLTEVRVARERVTVIGYDRSRFGGWANSGACTTRDVVLDAWTGDGNCGGAGAAPEEGHGVGPGAGSGKGFGAGSGTGPGADPYTGEPLPPDSVDVDHVYPLAAAWDFGAHAWSPARRREFANDAARNLVPTASAVNREKSDATPAEWLPGPPELRCPYSARYLEVAVAWDLPVSVADWEAMAAACGIR